MRHAKAGVRLAQCFGALIVSAFLLGVGGFTSSGNEDLGLPELNKINNVTLSPSYSCRSEYEPRKGYGETALFLSRYSRRMNYPELLFNGACAADDYFQSSVAGDDMNLIADLGEMSLENVTPFLTFNTRGVHSFGLYTRFAEIARIQTSHTYAVLVNRSDRRSLFVFTVVDYVPNVKVEINYAVKLYEVLRVENQSSGWAWDSPNYR